MGISFEDGMKILNAAREELRSGPATPPPAAPHKPVLSDEQAHAFQLMMLVTGQHGDGVGRGRVGSLHDAIDVRPKPGTQPFKLDPNAKPTHVQRDDRLQETRRAETRAEWAAQNQHGLGTAEDPGWTN